MRILILIFGVFSCSTAVLWIKASTTDPVLLSGYRTLLAGALLNPLFWRAVKRHPGLLTWSYWRGIIPAAALLCLHFISWNVGARMTPAANASLIVNVTPVAMPFFLYFLMRERLNRAEIIGTTLAMIGVFLLGVSDFNTSPAYFLGDVVAFVSMLLYAAYLAWGRLNRHLPSIYLYVVPVYVLAGVFSLALGIPYALLSPEVAWLGEDVLHELAMIAGLALVPTILGHSIINWAMQVFRGQVVAIINLGQFISAGIMAWFVFREIPTTGFFVAVGLVVTGAVIVVRGEKRPAVAGRR